MVHTHTILVITSFSVVDGLPVVGSEKVEKLTAVLRKLFNNEKLGEVREGGLVGLCDG